jgi:hypothetical protein
MTKLTIALSLLGIVTEEDYQNAPSGPEPAF